MKVISAFLLAKLGGNENPTKADLKKIFESVGAEFDEEKIDLFFSLIKNHDVTELIAAGREKMGALSSGGGSAVATVADAPSVAEPAAETKKKVEEEKEESDDGEGMMSLFD